MPDLGIFGQEFENTIWNQKCLIWGIFGLESEEGIVIFEIILEFF